MAHNVFFGKIALGNALDLLQHMQRIHKAAAGAFRQVDLGHIAGHNDLGTHAHAGQEHFHLLRRGVLCLVQNDEGVVQRTAAHIGQRGHLNDLFFHQTLICFSTQHIKQTVIQRAQIRVHLLLQITGQKTQFLPCFYRRAGQHDAGHLLGLEGLYGHSYGEVGLTGARRADTKGDGIVPDGIQVFLLAQRLGPDGPPFDRNRYKILGQFPHPFLSAVMGQADAVAHSLILQRGMVLDQKKHAFHRAAGRRYVGRFAGEPELCAPADGRNGELVFQQPDVPVAVAKDRRGDLYTIQFNVLFCHVLLLMCLLR